MKNLNVSGWMDGWMGGPKSHSLTCPNAKNKNKFRGLGKAIMVTSLGTGKKQQQCLESIRDLNVVYTCYCSPCIMQFTH